MCFGGAAGTILGTVFGGPIGGAVGGVAGSLLDSRSSRGGGGGGGAGPVAGPAPPQAKSEMPDRTNFAAERGGVQVGDIPTFLGVNSSMNMQQQRARLATLGTSGEYGNIGRPTQGPYAGRGVEDVAREYYRNIALMSLTGPDGSVLPGAEILPVEQQYLREVLGKTPKSGDASSFLSQLFA